MTEIRRPLPDERETLLGIWLRSVRATHAFLTEDDIAFYRPLVRDALASDLELWAAYPGGRIPAGFMALDDGSSPVKIEALFIDPAHARRGLGTLLVRRALAFKGPLILDVNEQNPGALAFYLRLGFIQTGRSPLDGAGKPFPLIHMRHPGPEKRV